MEVIIIVVLDILLAEVLLLWIGLLMLFTVTIGIVVLLVFHWMKGLRDGDGSAASKSVSFKPATPSRDGSKPAASSVKGVQLDHTLTAGYRDIDDSSMDDGAEKNNGLSMLAYAVQRDGSNVDAKGQRCNIFQSECKIQEKVCKLIIDGGSFTNAIRLDLVYALSLSTRRLSPPRYIQWMNQAGTQKITHKVIAILIKWIVMWCQ
uniref:Uncharacterized protein n=1 Tax=Oryza barthii TaxID=65489 RepID=A0A0D3HU84_9ORYZ